jgi:outer membrane protein TolC
MMKKFFVILLTAQTILSQVRELTIESAIELAIENNHQLRIARLEIEKASDKLLEARSGLIPRISATGNYSRYIKKPVLFLPPDSPFGRLTGGVIEIGFDNTYLGGISLQVPVFMWSIYSGIRIANKNKILAEENYKANLLNTISSVKKAFYGALLAKEIYELTKKRLENAIDNLENVRKMYEQGVVSEYDYIRAQVQVENLKPLLLQAENNLKVSKNLLKLAIGLDVKDRIEIKGEMRYDPEFSIDFNLALKELLQNNPELKQVELQRQISAEVVSMEISGHLPSLFLIGSFQYQAQANDFNFGDYRWIKTTFLGVQIQIPIFNGFETRAKIEQARITFEQSVERVISARKMLENELQNTIYKIEQAKRRIKAQEKSIELAEKGYQIAMTRYKNGIGTQIEVNDAEVNLAQAKLNYLQAIYDFLTAISDLEKLMGKLPENFEKYSGG